MATTKEAIIKASHSSGFLCDELRKAYRDSENRILKLVLRGLIEQSDEIKRTLEVVESELKKKP